MLFPKVTTNKSKGTSGQAYFECFVYEKLKCIYHPIHEENDFGIDGYIELVVNGNATSKLVGVQIKHGNSYFNKLTKLGYKYVGEQKHLNYYLNNQSPIFIVIMDNDFQRMNWIQFKIEKTIPINEINWCIEIPKENELKTNFKEAIFNEAGPIIDFGQQIQFNWAINSILQKTDRKVIAIPKYEIIKNSFRTINEYINRMSIDNELLINARTSLDIYFPEFSIDSREIFQIPEIMQWLKQSIDIGIPWFYFLDYRQTSTCFNLLVHSYCGITNMHITEEKYLCEYNKIDLKNFLEKNFDNMNKFMEKNHIDERINKEITDGIINLLVQKV